MGELKSARELAMERIAKMTADREADPSAKLRWEYEPKGQEIAGKYMEDNKVNIEESLIAIDNAEGREVVKKAVQTVLLENVILCDTLHEKRRVERALGGLREIKEDKASFDEIVQDLMMIYQHNSTEGQQQRKQVKESLTRSYMQHIQQMGAAEGVNYDMSNVNPEEIPEFQQQLRHFINQIDEGYKQGIADVKKRMAALK
ncbi:MAG: hypothetical protein FWF37_02010 [Chloroflexi bacterium]|nr:hypothetical protein [Chloroflexota bacterium]